MRTDSIITVTNRGNLPTPIAEMAPWSFWSRPDALGFPAEEVAALSNGTASNELQFKMQQRATSAMARLVEAPVNETMRPS